MFMREFLLAKFWKEFRVSTYAGLLDEISLLLSTDSGGYNSTDKFQCCAGNLFSESCGANWHHVRGFMQWKDWIGW
jgi:hypothetical protein